MIKFFRLLDTVQPMLGTKIHPWRISAVWVVRAIRVFCLGRWPRIISNYDLLAQCQQGRPSSPGSDGAGLARAAQACQLHHQSCNPKDLRRKAEAWSTEGNLAKNCGSGNEEQEPQLGHHPEAGQWQTGVEELRCCPIHQLAWRVVMMMIDQTAVLSWSIVVLLLSTAVLGCVALSV